MYFFAPSKSGFLAESYLAHTDEKEETRLTDEPMGEDDDEGGAAGSKQDGSMFV
eukprot:CAMPEP_0115294246 /NCGR_PEP_ID=MMETSP0270-20121206/66090_1 /TAXON_ID=71861 /ORGANISM="Scrippsiella trochoidea, Strain CCMP3099" /LENGTH=53 /DNA_ID=CAMNT_0002711779 /DNA_START=66 /DNA_END=223 /DNA_ORIENTATION=+